MGFDRLESPSAVVIILQGIDRLDIITYENILCPDSRSAVLQQSYLVLCMFNLNRIVGQICEAPFYAGI